MPLTWNCNRFEILSNKANEDDPMNLKRVGRCTMEQVQIQGYKDKRKKSPLFEESEMKSKNTESEFRSIAPC
jgi:hypothetical protein